MLEMTAAYGAIANGGIYRPPHAIVRIRDSQTAKIQQISPPVV